ncbi:MAG: VCBS repeat-containing protein [Chitinophagales bacterium]
MPFLLIHLIIQGITHLFGQTYDSDGDIDMYLSKCRLGVDDTLDGRRVNQLWENDGNNNYTDVAVAKGIVPYGQSWSTDFADIDNDGDWDAFVINHDKISTFYENIGILCLLILPMKPVLLSNY